MRIGDLVSAWAGDISELGDLADNLNRLAGIPSQATRDAARGIKRAIDDEFRAGLDPYGKPWTPLQESTIQKKGSSAILIETEAMRKGIKVRPMPGAGIAITSDAEYLGFHQGQGSPRAHVPPRHVLPEGELPDTWERAIADALDNAFERSFG